MKLLTLLLTVGSAFAAKNFEIRSKVAPTFVPKNPVMNQALSVRGGGGITKENLVTAYEVLMGPYGLVALAAPEVLAEKLYAGRFDLSEDSVGQMSLEFAGSTLIGIVLLAYLSTSTDLSTSKVIAYGTLPCAYSGFRRFIKGSFDKMGYMPGMGLVGYFLAPAVLATLILAGKGDTDLLTKINVACPFALGVVGSLLPGLGMKLQGLKDLDGVSEAMLGWFSATLTVWGVLAGSLVKGVDPHKAIFYATAVFVVLLLDTNYIRKQNDPLNMEPANPLVFTLIQSAIALGLFLENKEAKVASD